jgi:hypothetical protein
MWLWWCDWLRGLVAVELPRLLVTDSSSVLLISFIRDEEVPCRRETRG